MPTFSSLLTLMLSHFHIFTLLYLWLLLFQVTERAKTGEVYAELVKYLQMVRKKQKEPRVDTELVYAYAKVCGGGGSRARSAPWSVYEGSMRGPDGMTMDLSVDHIYVSCGECWRWLLLCFVPWCVGSHLGLTCAYSTDPPICRMCRRSGRWARSRSSSRARTRPTCRPAETGER